MIGRLKFLKNLVEVTPIPVALHNGMEMMVTKGETMKLSPEIVLYKVLYIPGLTCSLTSINQLIEDLNYEVIITT